MKDDSSWNAYALDLAIGYYRGVFFKDRKVTLSSFVMSQYEVTQELYEAVLKTDIDYNAKPSVFKTGPAKDEIQELRPVENVTWYEAVYFCNALTKLTMTEADFVYTITDVTRDSSKKFIKSATVIQNLTKKSYRLLTEAEWEYAARGGDPANPEWRNAFGKVNTKEDWMIDDPHSFIEDENLATVGWYKYNSNDRTHEVGKKVANILNLYDMLGNVWEWCWDIYSGSVVAETVTDPCGPTSGNTRVRRGGCYYNEAYFCICSYRFFLKPLKTSYIMSGSVYVVVPTSI